MTQAAMQQRSYLVPKLVESLKALQLWTMGSPSPDRERDRSQSSSRSCDGDRESENGRHASAWDHGSWLVIQIVTHSLSLSF
eukprot:1878356-Amphidinium_carterae.1